MIPIRDANPTHRVPALTVGLIGLNLLAWFLELGAEANGSLNDFVYTWALVPAQLLTDPVGEFPTLLTSMFLHGSWGHLLSNMLYLWIFGDNIEDQIGKIPFLFFYLFTGLCASGLQIVMDPTSAIPNLGASGAIAGVMGGYLLMFPTAQVVALVGWFVTRVPALIVLVIWFILQLIGGFGSFGAEEGGVAFFAHIGGFVAGVLFIRFFPRRPKPPTIYPYRDEFGSPY